MSEVFGKNPVTSSQFPAVLFDAGGTLLHFNPPLERFYFEQLQAHQPRTIDEINEAWVQMLASLNRRVEQDAHFEMTDDFWFPALLEELKIPEGDRAKIIEGAQANFSTSVRAVVAEPVILLCEILKERGYRLGIVSNWNYKLPEVLRLQGILDLFDVVVTAEEHLKPNPEPFMRALEDLELKPSQALHIGESFAVDVVGAQRAGMKAVLYDPTYRELKALAETTTESLSKVVSIETLRQNRRLSGVKVITKIHELLEFLV